MNYLVFVDTQAGELEKILSGTKRMLVKEYEESQPAGKGVSPGDSLFFIRDRDECDLRVKATVTRVQALMPSGDEDLSHTLKEKQTWLQLTEDQYNHWSIKKQVLLIEFGSAQKIPVIRIALEKVKSRSGWVIVEDLDLIKAKEVSPDNWDPHLNERSK